VTAVQDMSGTPGQAALYEELDQDGELTVRVYISYMADPSTPLGMLEEAAAPMRDRYREGMVRAGFVKLFMDGVFESYTAVALQDYPGHPGFRGEPVWEQSAFTRFVAEANRLGLQVATHACGDGGVRLALDGYEAAARIHPREDARHRIEHIEMLHPEDAQRFASLGVIASMQPLHAPVLVDGPDIWPRRLHEEDWERAFAWRTVRDAGGRIVFGSDWPVVTPDTVLALHAALNRKPWKPGHLPHTQTLEQTIGSYTRDAAYAEFQEEQRGQIKIGMLADLVLFSQDLFSLHPQEIRGASVDLTVCNGRVVFERE
jgi:predicted amidohydrolase YtcJ